MTITVIIDGVQYQWEHHSSGLMGWFRQEEWEGSLPLPSQEELHIREWRLETINNELNGKE
jgi:hypothetical protein